MCSDDHISANWNSTKTVNDVSVCFPHFSFTTARQSVVVDAEFDLVEALRFCCRYMNQS